MNDQTRDLLEKLATKLGTTAAHLWEVLVRQAPISAACDLLVLAVLIAACVGFAMWLRYSARCVAEADDTSGAEFGWGTSVILSGIAFAITLGVFLCAICSIDVTLSGFFNPEYWALKQVLSQVK